MKLHYDSHRQREVRDPREFGRVAVLLGGDSPEREVSLRSGAAVLEALGRREVQAQPFDPAERSLSELLSDGFDRAWIALHGRGGEDGSVQGALDYLGVPYTGSGVRGAALSMDKLSTKRLAIAVGVATADYVVLEGEYDFDAALERLGLPLVVKPAAQGSSLGISRIEHAGQLPQAYELAATYEHRVFAEAWISGRDYTVGVLQQRALPAIRIQKDEREEPRYHCPCGLSGQAEEHLGSLALAVFAAVDAAGWGRVDFMMDVTGRPLLLEIESVPDITSRSLVPMAARAAGIDFDDLVWRVLETSLPRYGH